MIKFFNSLLFVITIFLIFSCVLDEEKKPAEMPSEWSGGEDEFQNKFTTREDGNETLVLYRETDLPFEGQVERNGTNSNTVQSFKKFYAQFQTIESYNNHDSGIVTTATTYESISRVRHGVSSRFLFES